MGNFTTHEALVNYPSNGRGRGGEALTPECEAPEGVHRVAPPGQ
jgi:hypothetical protein